MYRTKPTSKTQTNIEIVPSRLYFSIMRAPPQQGKGVLYYSVDTDPSFQYQPFFYDFGPPSLLLIHRFLCLTADILNNHNEKITFICSTYPAHITNATLFISAFRMIYMKLTPDEAYAPVSHLTNVLKPYRDASTLPSTYDLTVITCLRGLYHGMQLGWYNPEEFDDLLWEKLEQVENGDMNWLIPGKLLAFATPYATNVIQGGFHVSTPQDLVQTFKDLNINHIIRLCQKFYCEDIFIDSGFKHSELYFLDGSTPPITIREKFLEIIEGEDIVALHCKAGLGRTGTLAGCHLIKNFQFTGHEAIGWIRICRPGSVIGPQQRYLLKYYDDLKKATCSSPTKTKAAPPSSPTRPVPTHREPNTASPTRNITPRSIQPNSPKRKPASTAAKSPTSATRVAKTPITRVVPKQSNTRPPTARTRPVPPPIESQPKEDDLSLQVQAVSISPHYPQPRKYKSTAHSKRITNSRK